MSGGKRRRRRWKVKRRELKLEELSAIVERTRVSSLTEQEYATLVAAVETLAFVTAELETKGTTLARLRKLLFGASTEKTSRVVGQAPADHGRAPDAASAVAKGAGSHTAPSEKPKPPGHGRNGAVAYRGAEKVQVPHTSMHGGEGCPGWERPTRPRVQGGVSPLSSIAHTDDQLARCTRR